MSVFNLTYLECDRLGRFKFTIIVTKTSVMITRHSFQADMYLRGSRFFTSMFMQVLSDMTA